MRQSFETDHQLRLRRARAIVWIVTLVLIYLTAVPFHFDPSDRGVASRWERATLVPFGEHKGHRLSATDVLGNLLLFIPVGFAIHGWMMERRLALGSRIVGTGRVSDLRLLPTLAIGFLISLTIEAVQLLFDDRYTSINDTMGNVASTAIGAILARACYSQSLSGALRVWRDLASRPATLALLSACTAYSLWQLAPFSFTLGLNNLEKNLIDWRQTLTLAQQQGVYLFAVEGVKGELLEQFGVAFFIGAMLAFWQRSRRTNESTRFPKSWIFLTIFFVLVMAAQLLVRIRNSHPQAHLLLAALGGMNAGLLVDSVLTASHDNSAAESNTYRVTHIMVGFYLCFYLFILLRPEYPPIWELPLAEGNHSSAMQFAEVLKASISLKVFQNEGSTLMRLFLKQFLISIPVSFLVASFFNSIRPVRIWRQILPAMLLSLSFALLTQAIRFTLIGSNPNLVSVIAVTCGLLAGLRMQHWWRHERNNFAARE